MKENLLCLQSESPLLGTTISYQSDLDLVCRECGFLMELPYCFLGSLSQKHTPSSVLLMPYSAL